MGAVEQLLGLALQGRGIMHRHTWLPTLLLTRPSMGTNSLHCLERGLEALVGIELSGPRKLQAIASLTAITSALVQNEVSVGIRESDTLGASRLSAALASGSYPYLARAFAESSRQLHSPEDVFTQLILRQLRGEGITQG